MFADSLAKEFLVHGTLLFLIGLLNGLAVQRLRNPRLGLSAHLAAVQGALALWCLGLLWPQVELSPGLAWMAATGAIAGIEVLWLALLLAALWGTSRATPLAGAGHQASPLREQIVAMLLAAGSVTCIVATVLVLAGLL